MKTKKHHIVRNILLGILSFLLLVVIILVVTYLILVNINPNKDRTAHIENTSGYVKANGTNFYDGNGDILQLRGVNLGNYFVQENWMAVSSVGSFDTGSYTQLRGRQAMEANPNLSDEQIEELETLYLETYLVEEDIKTIADLGLNTVRIPITYLNLTTDGETLKDDAFYYLDRLISWCENYDLYAIVDLHGAIGSQNQDQHSGDDSQFNLYGNEENENKTINLWKEIATHYKDNKTVAAYDLLNEPRRAVNEYGGKINFDYYDKLYQAVREVDENHVILIECFTFPIHGARLSNYDWENVAIEYHIYNLTSLSQKTCLNFYKALHNFMGYHLPVYIGEFSCWDNEDNWNTTLDFFDNLYWSYSSWTYKTNAYNYSRSNNSHKNWGLLELDIKRVNLYTATYEDIKETYSQTASANATKTLPYDIYQKRFAGE